MINIAVDGPAGSGKSTISKLVANKLNEEYNMIYLDTGAIYRAVAYYLIKNISDSDIDNENMVVSISEDLSVDIRYIDGQQRVYINGDDVTPYLRTEKVGEVTSKIAKYKKLRDILLDLQRDFAKNNNVIMDGRDIGTCVLPNASLKIFLVADVNERARRRYEQYKESGHDYPFKKILSELRNRDNNDINRSISPLKKADDAVEIDTTSMSIEEVVDKIIFELRKNCG